MLARRLAASVVISWPALLLADELPPDGPLNGKADDLVTLCITLGLIAGLVAAGWLKPLGAVLWGVIILGTGVPILFEAIHPTECPPGASGMDCTPVSFAAIAVLPGLIVVLAGSLLRWGLQAPAVELIPR